MWFLGGSLGLRVSFKQQVLVGLFVQHVRGLRDRAQSSQALGDLLLRPLTELFLLLLDLLKPAIKDWWIFWIFIILLTQYLNWTAKSILCEIYIYLNIHKSEHTQIWLRFSFTCALHVLWIKLPHMRSEPDKATAIMSLEILWAQLSFLPLWHIKRKADCYVRTALSKYSVSSSNGRN